LEFTVNTSQFDSNPDKVDHWTPESHWCGDCMHWVIDCVHMVEPLDAEHHVVEDGWIRSLACNRVTQCLEVRFTWKTVTQFHPVPLSIIRQIWKARPMNMTLEKLIMKNQRIRFEEVRTKGKLLASLLRGWVMIAPKDLPVILPEGNPGYSCL